jgi:hypothetical protein
VIVNVAIVVLREAASFNRIPDIIRLRVGCFNTLPHLARQHDLVIERLLEARVGMLPLDGDAEQSAAMRSP